MFVRTRFRLSLLACCAALSLTVGCADGDPDAVFDGDGEEETLQRYVPPGDACRGNCELPDEPDFDAAECAVMCENLVGTCDADLAGSTVTECVAVCTAGAFTDLEIACLADTPCGIIQTACFPDPITFPPNPAPEHDRPEDLPGFPTP